MDHGAQPLGSVCLQRRLIHKSARSASTSINSNNQSQLGTRCAVNPAVVCTKVDKHMLKITKQAENARISRVSLHGHFTGEYVPELEKTLSTESTDTGKIALDLSNVTFVDREAMVFLCGAKSRNVAIENIPSYVIRWIEQEGRCGSSHPKSSEK